MFRDLNEYRPRRPEPPDRKPQQLTRKQENVIFTVIFFNVVMALFGPFCGSSVIEAVISVFGRF
jgi:hypothetical protein